MRRRAEPRLRTRGTDRAEDVVAGLLTVIAAIGLLLALSAGASAHADAVDRGRAEARTRIPTTATLTGDAPLVAMADRPGVHAAQTAAPVTWTAPDGSLRTGLVPATAGAARGRTVPIWTERDGTLAEAPTSTVAALLAAATAGARVSLLAAVVVAGAWWGTRRITSMLNSHAWEREWAAIEPQWRRNTH